MPGKVTAARAGRLPILGKRCAFLVVPKAGGFVDTVLRSDHPPGDLNQTAARPDSGGAAIFAQRKTN